MKSTIRLFKALPINEKRKERDLNPILLKQMIPHGFLLSPEVIHNYSETELKTLIKTIKKEFGLNGEQMNQSFHKSWKKIEDASYIQLVIEQLFHYITTYGYEELGIYSKDSVYIPIEKLEIPEIDVETFHFIIIKGYTKKELKIKLLDLLTSGIALEKETIDDVVDVATYLKFEEKEIETIKNKETKIILYKYLNKIPKNPIEFLRYCVYEATNQTLLIKNNDLLERIRESKNFRVLYLFQKYEKEYGLELLAQIFFRFKPIFLAFRTNTQMKKITNKLRKLATVYHAPMKQDYLNEITSLIQQEKINETRLKKELLEVNIFRKIRLAYALNYRLNEINSILYKIRNGKGFATTFHFNHRETARRILSIVLDSVISDIKPKITGKKIYIPENIYYALPATEKQFIGNFPSGSFISLLGNMIIGVHWENLDKKRIDLDFSLIKDGMKLGWDGSYRSDKLKILFSGDLTDAPKPKGASELFYIKKQELTASIALINFFNYKESLEVPFKIIIARGQAAHKAFVVDPNQVITTIKSKITEKQKIIGLVKCSPEECRFYFTEAHLGCSITSSNKEYIKHARKYLNSFTTNPIDLRVILQEAGGIMVQNKDECDIDLSPEILEKDTILKLLY